MIYPCRNCSVCIEYLFYFSFTNLIHWLLRQLSTGFIKYKWRRAKRYWLGGNTRSYRQYSQVEQQHVVQPVLRWVSLLEYPELLAQFSRHNYNDGCLHQTGIDWWSLKGLPLQEAIIHSTARIANAIPLTARSWIIQIYSRTTIIFYFFINI